MPEAEKVTSIQTAPPSKRWLRRKCKKIKDQIWSATLELKTLNATLRDREGLSFFLTLLELVLLGTIAAATLTIASKK